MSEPVLVGARIFCAGYDVWIVVGVPARVVGARPVPPSASGAAAHA